MAEDDLQPDAEDEAPAAGQGRSPETGRFVKGTSGNPRGRPRRRPSTGGSLTFPALERALGRTVETDYGDGRQGVTLTEKLINDLTRTAGEGNVAAARELLQWIGESERARAEQALADAEAEARAAEAAARAAEAADDEPTYPLGWDRDQFFRALQGWNVCVRRGDKFYLRQWVASYGLLGGPPAREDDPWPWRPAVDPIGEGRCMREVEELKAAIARGEITETEAPHWRPDRAKPAAEAMDRDEPRERPSPPMPEQDWVERLAHRNGTVGGGGGGGGWMG